MSSQTSRAVDTGRAALKEIIKEPVKEAVREVLAENEARGKTGQIRERLPSGADAGDGRRVWRPRRLLGLVALAALSYYGRRRAKSIIDSLLSSDSSSETDGDTREGKSDISGADASDRVAVESGGRSETDDTHADDENAPP